MLNPIGFIVLPFRLRFIIRLEDEVMVEVKFYLFFFYKLLADPELFIEKAVLSPLLYNVVLMYPARPSWTLFH